MENYFVQRPFFFTKNQSLCHIILCRVNINMAPHFPIFLCRRNIYRPAAFIFYRYFPCHRRHFLCHICFVANVLFLFKSKALMCNVTVG